MTTIYLTVVNEVKPVEVSESLRWVSVPESKGSGVIWYSETGGGRYSVRRWQGQWRWLFYCGTRDDVDPTEVQDEVAGKESCEDHWRRFVEEKSKLRE